MVRLTNKSFYETRRLALLELGFYSYHDYLISDLWMSIRESVMRQDDYTCLLCGDEATQVHHQLYEYDDLVGNRFDNLIAVCADCHHAIEFCGRTKRTGPSARRQCMKMMRQRIKELRS